MRRVACSSPYCENEFPVRNLDFDKREYFFCRKCRKAHSTTVLVAQADHEKPIDKLILEAAIFNTAHGMSAYIGVSFVTLYHWIEKYFGMTFQEFRRTYICESSNCYLLNIERSSYSRSDYVLRKIRSKRYCACINALDPGHIMTKAPLHVVANLLKNRPKLKQLEKKSYVVSAVPFSFDCGVTPFYYHKLVRPFYYS